MSYKISYLVPKKEFKCLIGKKQPRAVSVKSHKALKKMSAPRRRLKPKMMAEKWERTRKAKCPHREKNWGKRVKQSGVKKKHRICDPWAWGENQTSTEIPKWGESKPNLKKSKKENAEKYFDDVPKKKTKVSRLMKFMDKNKKFVQVGDDFEILIRNKVVPGSDFIEIMNYLQKGREAKEHTFIPTRDPRTGMPVGTSRFIDALHEEIKGESITRDMSKEDVNRFAKKPSEFAGLKMDGVQEIVQEMTNDRGRSVNKIRVDNKDYLAELEADEEKQEEEQARARQVFEDMEVEDREVCERQAQEVAKRARNRRRKQKRFQYAMLRRIKDDVEEEPLTSLDDEEDVEESRKDARHKRRKQLVKSLKMVGKMIDKKLKGEMEVDLKTKKRIAKTSLPTKTFRRYREAKNSSPGRFRDVYTLDHLDKLHKLSLRRVEKMGIPTVKELIELEEKSVRTPTVKEILRDKPLNAFDDVRKTLPFAEGDDTEVEGEEEEEVAVEPGEAAVEPEEVEEREEMETS